MDWITIEQSISDTYARITKFSSWGQDDNGLSVVTFNTDDNENIIMLEADFKTVMGRINIGAMGNRKPHTKLWNIFQEAGSSPERPHIKEYHRCQEAAARQMQVYFGEFIK